MNQVMISLSPHRLNRGWVLTSLVVFLVMFTATLLAYTKHIPIEIKQIPYYDSIGHFLLFGILSFVLYHALSGRCFVFRGHAFPISGFVVICYALIDEYLQLLSDTRSFDPSDLFFGILGVVVFTLLAIVFPKTRRQT